MKELKLSRNDLHGDAIIRFSYCSIQSLLQGMRRIGYNCGVYGWNWDAYRLYIQSINKVIIITTGYRSLVGITPDYKLVKEYETKSENLYNQYKWTDYDTIAAERKNLLIELVERILTNEK